MRLDGGTVVVSGASGGIGAATAVECARRGAATVVLLARRKERLDEVAGSVRDAGADARLYAVDLSDAEATASVTEAVRRDVGDTDVLVNNAGAGRWLFAEETSPSEAVAMAAVPYLAAFWLTAGLLPGMLRRRRGHVVTVNSPACFLAWSGATGYVAARWALRGLHEALLADLAGTGVGASMVVPGKVASEYFEANPGTEARLPRIARVYRTLTPASVACLIADAVEHGRRLVVRPRLLQATVWWARHFPWTVSPFVRGTGYRRRSA